MKKLILAILVILTMTAGCITVAPSGEAGDGELPTAYIDSILPAEAALGETVVFNGHGTDPDGTVVAHRWRSDVDGDLSTMASFDTSSLSANVHTIYFKVQDNNGNWSAEVRSSVTVSGGAVAGPIITSFEAGPGSIASGGFSTLSWSVSGATTVSIDQGIGPVAVTGTTTVSPVTTTSYILTATSGADSATATTQVVVSGAAPPAAGLPVITSFAAVPPMIDAGGWTSLSWNVSDATSVIIDPGVGPVGFAGSAPVSPAATTDYTLTATNAVGWYSVTITVVVGAAPAAGGPDLVILDIWRVGSTIHYTIKNQGDVPAGATTSALVIDGVVKGYDSVGSLPAGASSSESFGYSYTCSGASDAIVVHADTGTDVAESSEANNACSEGWTCMVIITPPLIITLKPNLVIQNIWLVHEMTGDRIYYRIKNEGLVTADASITALRFYLCVYPCPPVATDYVAPLAAGEARDEKFGAYNYTGIGTTVAVHADENENVAEYDEEDNSREEPTAGL